ncbi:haloacid dehalogenase [Thozetella sp. PMI_491]|nr:haloacid dehalogenase [Thozetella sp. PMI_491]
MPKRNLLLCFDAFGTLFSPKLPIFQQYGDVARQCGLAGFTDDQLQSSFRAAFKSEAKLHPNYGKSSGLGAERWWTNVIGKTFQPLVGAEQTLPADLAPTLLHRFASSEGYSAAPGLVSLLQALRRPAPRKLFDNIVIGVISNSDDRVPDILSSLGLQVSPLRYEVAMDRGAIAAIAKEQFDVDFHCLSYDAGAEKPDRRIFTAADELATEIIRVRHGLAQEDTDLSTWDKLYVGDEYEKDVVGALGAGWRPLLLTSDGQAAPPGSTQRLEGQATPSIDGTFSASQALSIDSIEGLVQWLCGKQ